MRNNNSLVVYFILGVFATTFLLAGCDGNNGNQSRRGYQKEGLDKVIQENSDKQNFTVLLNDMDYQSNKYLHKYQIVYPITDSTFKDESTGWYPVTDAFFQANLNNLGMELASKSEGQLVKNVAPAGYSQYVGNEKYGQWQQRSGGSFWEFYGKYAFFSSMFHMMSPSRYGHYNDYNRNYRGSGRSYYGPTNNYGTKSYGNSTTGKNSNWSKKPQSFKDNVRSRVSQSSSRTSSSTASKQRTTRNTNRYNRTSSTRSRGGGFGK